MMNINNNTNKKEKILVLSPILFKCDLNTIKEFKNQLLFLEDHFDIDFVDCLKYLNKDEPLNEAVFYDKWKNYLLDKISHYNILIGFSFGGCILQQLFPFLTHFQKKIILFSTPSFADASLEKKLTHIINLIESNKLSEALFEKERLVHYPNMIQIDPNLVIENPHEASKRLINGLLLLLKTDSRELLKKHDLEYYHFIGEESFLVNINNVIYNKNLIIVPNAGMRVLQDNFSFCKNKINELLGR